MAYKEEKTEKSAPIFLIFYFYLFFVSGVHSMLHQNYRAQKFVSNAHVPFILGKPHF